MTQDTRKDRRVKIVSLNVRYKSATVDEFIENHAHDVSRGGIYIKTPTPFPQGTLLKFEIRLASDQTVITGVGRVVWKREAAEGEQPAGMGVKFIKVDDSSKVVIDRLVTSKSDAGKAFESEPDPTARPSAPAEAMGPPSAPPGSKRKMTPYKLASPGLSAGPPPIPRTSASSGTPSSGPRPVAPSPLFPKATSVPPDGLKPEQTVMKQAAELLEEALREAGGSMEEVGTNPLFSGSGDLPAPDAKGAGAPMGSTSAAPPAHSSKAPAKADEGAAARGMVAALSPGQVAAKSGVGESPRRPAVSTSIRAPRKSGTRLGLILGALGVIAILGVVLNKDRLFGSGPEPVPPSAAPPPPSPSIAAPPAEAPAPSASAAPAPSAEPSSQPSLPAASASASSGSKAEPAVPPPRAAPQATKPAVAAQAPATTPTPTAQAPSAPATAAPDSSSGAPSAASTTPRAPKPVAPPVVKAPPKAAKPGSDNDNPY
jgi:uncharacterized protein (TIGR02266 family)